LLSILRLYRSETDDLANTIDEERLHEVTTSQTATLVREKGRSSIAPTHIIRGAALCDGEQRESGVQLIVDVTYGRPHS
jgi:hypothetical protein